MRIIVSFDIRNFIFMTIDLVELRIAVAVIAMSMSITDDQLFIMGQMLYKTFEITNAKGCIDEQSFLWPFNQIHPDITGA